METINEHKEDTSAKLETIQSTLDYLKDTMETLPSIDDHKQREKT